MPSKSLECEIEDEDRVQLRAAEERSKVPENMKRGREVKAKAKA